MLYCTHWNGNTLNHADLMHAQLHACDALHVCVRAAPAVGNMPQMFVCLFVVDAVDSTGCRFNVCVGKLAACCSVGRTCNQLTLKRTIGCGGPNVVLELQPKVPSTRYSSGRVPKTSRCPGLKRQLAARSAVLTAHMCMAHAAACA